MATMMVIWIGVRAVIAAVLAVHLSLLKDTIAMHTTIIIKIKVIIMMMTMKAMMIMTVV